MLFWERRWTQINADRLIMKKLKPISIVSVFILLIAIQWYGGQLHKLPPFNQLAIIINILRSQLLLKSTLTGHSDSIESLAISPDGQTLVSGGYDKTISGHTNTKKIKIWNLGTGELKSTLTGYSSAVNSLAISPDGRTLVSGSYNGTIKTWRLE